MLRLVGAVLIVTLRALFEQLSSNRRAPSSSINESQLIDWSLVHFLQPTLLKTNPGCGLMASGGPRPGKLAEPAADQTFNELDTAVTT